MIPKSLGSLTKEFPLSYIDRTIQAIRPGMTLEELREYAKTHSHGAIPTLLTHRFLLLAPGGAIVYDHFLSLVAAEGIASPRVRKVMYLIWALRDPRIAQFATEVVADSTGKWRVGQLTRKSNSKFFEKYFEPRTAPKVRSNFEYFLVESNILDLRAGDVHLELEDGWLAEGMRVAAQHERNAARRRSMTIAPAQFLISESLWSLVSATRDELKEFSAESFLDAEQLEDIEIWTPGTATTTEGKLWDRPKPTYSSRRGLPIVIDAVARERASVAHWNLEKIVRDAAVVQGYEPKIHVHMDMYFGGRTGHVLAEIKSCTNRNLHSQVRRGVSQLLEYRYRFAGVVGSDRPVLVLVAEVSPEPEQGWLVDFLRTLGILLVWKEPGRDQIVSRQIVPEVLSGVVSQLEESKRT